MSQLPKDVDQLINSPEAAKLLKNKDAIKALSSSPDAQKFIQMLTQKSGGNLQAAAQAAMKGDTSQLSQLVNEVTKNPEAAQAISNITKNIPK